VTLIFTFILITLSLFSLVGVMVLLSYYAAGDLAAEDSPSVTYGPGDTQDVFFSPILCQQLSTDTATLYSSDYETSSFYLLNTMPSLTGTVNITFEDQIVVSNQHNQRNFHFYPDSVIAFEVCANNESHSVASFYLIKGQKLYKDWVSRGENSSPHYVWHLQVRELCGQGKQAFEYKVTGEDQYYFVVVNDDHVASAAEIDISYDIQRTVYEFNESSVVTSCNFSTSPCSVRVPFQSTVSALLVYGAPQNWEGSWANAAISVDCGIRVWLYALMSVAGVLLITAGTVCLCVSCCCCGRCIKAEDEMNKPLLNERTAHMYNFPSNSSELSNPTKDDWHRATPTTNVSIHHPKKGGPYPPPSFKASGKFSLGSPTYETFTK
jgi:hypothetical protein